MEISKWRNQRKKKDTVSSIEFKKDNERITNKREIVNRFNEYFVNVGASLAKKITATNLSFISYLKKSLNKFRTYWPDQ